jgi:hypothetical protein
MKKLNTTPTLAKSIIMFVLLAMFVTMSILVTVHIGDFVIQKIDYVDVQQPIAQRTPMYYCETSPKYSLTCSLIYSLTSDSDGVPIVFPIKHKTFEKISIINYIVVILVKIPP